MTDKLQNDRELAKQTFDTLWKKEIDLDVVHVPSPKVWIRTISEECGAKDGARILEVGAGSGSLAIELTVLGARMTLLDINRSAMSLSTRLFASKNMSGNFIVAEAGAIPIRDNTYDAVYSSGLLEHFSKAEARRFLAEMGRVTRPGGRVVIMVPSARGILYRIGKRWMERHGKWMWGKEDPVWTFRCAKVPGLKMVGERQVDFLTQVSFLSPKGAKKISPYLVRWAKGRDDIPGLGRIFGSYLLVSVFEKIGSKG